MHCCRRLIVQTLVFSRSYLHRQVSPPETLVVKGRTTWARNGRWILPENARLPHNIQGSFTCRKSITWDKRLYFPSEGRRADEYFVLKNRRLRPGLNPRTWVPKATTLPLDHRSRLFDCLPRTSCLCLRASWLGGVNSSISFTTSHFLNNSTTFLFDIQIHILYRLHSQYSNPFRSI